MNKTNQDNLPFILSGHIHSNQKLQRNIYYPGSSMQHAFGESDRNIIAFVNLIMDDIYILAADIDLNGSIDIADIIIVVNIILNI